MHSVTRFRQSIKKPQRSNTALAVEKEFAFNITPVHCLKCNSKNLFLLNSRSHVVFDLRFMRQGIKRWMVWFRYGNYRYSRCCHIMTNYRRDWQYGANLCAYVVYLLIEMR